MLVTRRHFLPMGLASVALASALASDASAQAYPLRPITIVVPFPAGGPSDIVGRLLAERMREYLGQPIIIENIGGAAGSLGTGRVARAAPDGYTLVLGYWGTHVVNGAIYKLPYDVVGDFAPIALLPGQPLMIVARKAIPANSLQDLVAWLKANAGKASHGTAGIGSIGHVAGLLLQKATATQFQFVPYRGAALVMQDLVSGQIDLTITSPATSVAQVRAGLIKGYAITARNRLDIAPEIPTVDEAGIPGLHLSLWQGLWAPKGTPSGVIAKLNSAIRFALADPSTTRKLADQGFDALSREQQSPNALGSHQQAEIDRWWPILRAANVKGE